MFIEPVEITRLSCALAFLAEGDLAQSTYLVKNMSDLFGTGNVDRELSTVSQLLFFRQLGYLCLHQVWVLGWSDLLILSLMPSGRGCLPLRAIVVMAVLQYVCPEPKIVHHISIAAVGAELLMRDDVADSYPDAVIAFVDQFMWQHGGAESGMDHACHLEQRPVVAFNEHWDDRCLCHANDPSDVSVPGRIDNATTAKTEVRYFAGREGAEHASALDPFRCLFQWCNVCLNGLLASEWVDEDGDVMYLRYSAEEIVTEHL